jgi:hypothetical protein
MLRDGIARRSPESGTATDGATDVQTAVRPPIAGRYVAWAGSYELPTLVRLRDYVSNRLDPLGAHAGADCAAPLVVAPTDRGFM